MPVTLLPASAAAHAPRASATIVLGKKPEPWLTQTLKRTNRVNRPLNSVAQHHRCLTETLSQPTAIWTLCSLLLPKAPADELNKDDNPLVEALTNYQWLHVEAYVVHVDMVSQSEVAFKLTADAIESLIEYHKDIWSVDESAANYNWSEKEVQLKKLQDDFVQAINKFVFRTQAIVLEGLEEDGAGELLVGAAEEVKNKILGMFLPLMPPPPPPAPQVVRPAPILPSSPAGETWWPSAIASQQRQQQQQQTPQQQPQQQQQMSQEQWRAISTSPSPSPVGQPFPPSWSNVPMTEPQSISPVVTPEYSPPYSPAEVFTPDCYTSPEYFPASLAPCDPYSMPMQFPSMMTGQCGTSSAMGNFDAYAGGMGNFETDFGFTSYTMPSMLYTSPI